MIEYLVQHIFYHQIPCKCKTCYNIQKMQNKIQNNEKSPCQAASWDLEMLSSWPIDEICGKQLIYPPH